MSTEIIVPERQSLDAYLPKTGRDVLWMANEVAKAGIYMNGTRAMSGHEIFVVMMKGAELGLTPLQSLTEIYLIKGKPVVSKDVLTARIVRSPRITHWDPSDCDAQHCTIRFQIRGEDPVSITTRIDDIPQRYFAASRSGEPSNWTLIPEDMLYAWTVRRIARRWVPEALLDIGPAEDAIDETKVIDIAKVEQQMPDGEKSWPCSADCGGRMFLHSNPKGGVYLRCANCNATDVPPPEVRELVRGTPEALTIAAASDEEVMPSGAAVEPADAGEPAALPADVTPPPSEEPAVQSETGGGASEPAPIEAYDDDPGHVHGSGDATASPADLPRLAPSEHLRAYLRNNRTATGQRHIAIRDALLDAGWDGKSGISATIDSLSEEAITKLLDTFARPNFGELP